MDILAGLFQEAMFLLRYFNNLWILLIIISVVVAIYIFVDSNRRDIRAATFWRIAAVVNVALFMPTVIVAFDLLTAALTIDWSILALFAYMGVASSIIAVGLGIGYWINFRELHYEAAPVYDPNVLTPPPPVYAPAPQPAQPRAAYKPSKPKANAWLVMKSSSKSYQLNQGTTTVGRSTNSDIPILNDPTVSGQHIKIVEEHGHYKMIDLGSTNGTWVNNYRVHQPVLLDINDEIRLGDNTYMKFVAS